MEPLQGRYMIRFAILNHNSDNCDEARNLLNDILYRSNTSNRINSLTDIETSAVYAVAYDNDTAIGVARLSLTPSVFDAESSEIIKKIKTFYPEFILYSHEKLAALVCRNTGLAVIPEFRKGIHSIHIGNTLQLIRQNIAYEHKKKFILMFSRPQAWNLAERNRFIFLKEASLTTEGIEVQGRWYMKKTEKCPIPSTVFVE